MQPLLDAVVDYLPSPLDVDPPVAHSGNEKAVVLPKASAPLVALAFKVSHDKHRGPIVYFESMLGRCWQRQRCTTLVAL